MPEVTIVEVGPRDGFQAVPGFIPTDQKIAIIEHLVDSGLSRIEIGSFVSPTALPQMRDIIEVLDVVRGRPHPELSVLVPNRKGAERALAAGVDNLVFVISASEAHNHSNVRRSVAASLEELRAVLTEIRPTGRFRFNLATAFHCPFEGATPQDQVMRLVEAVLDLAPDAEICLCDTTGKAVPAEVSALFQSCFLRFGTRSWAYHAHDTYGFGSATTMAAYNEGVRTFDAAIAGLGGCPFAPGASGNVATEDIAYLFERSGFTSGIAFPKLLDAATLAASIEGGQASGRIRHIQAVANF